MELSKTFMIGGDVVHLRFKDWVLEKARELEEYDIETKMIRITERSDIVTDPVVVIEHVKKDCAGEITVWESGNMEVELIELKPGGKRLLYLHEELDSELDFDAILWQYFDILMD